MPSPEGWETVSFPPETMKKITDMQRHMAEHEHLKLGRGMIARYLIDVAYAAKTSHYNSEMSTEVK